MNIDLDRHVTEHFTLREMLRSEAATRHGLSNLPESQEILDNIERVAEALEKIRAHYGRPVVVTSCYRSIVVNSAVGGARTSAHLKGLAADHTVPGIPLPDLCREIPQIVPDFDQIIYEFGPSGWCHLGLSVGEPRRQLLTAVKRGGRTVYKIGIVG